MIPQSVIFITNKKLLSVESVPQGLGVTGLSEHRDMSVSRWCVWWAWPQSHL